MIESDKSDNADGLTTGKRPREDDAENVKSEQPSKRPRSQTPDHPEKIDSDEGLVAPKVANGDKMHSEEEIEGKIDKQHQSNEQKDTIYQKEYDTNTKMDTSEIGSEKDESIEKLAKHEDSKDADGTNVEHSAGNTKSGSEDDMDDSSKENDNNAVKSNKKNVKAEETSKDSDEEGKSQSENRERNGLSKHNSSNDSEVVDGLELSVECASDKEASSSESEDQKNAKPRPKTTIIKAKPNDSELEVSSSAAEQSEKEENTAGRVKTKKRQTAKKSIEKASDSESEATLNNESDEKEYGSKRKPLFCKTGRHPPKKVVPEKSVAKKTGSSSKKRSDSESEDDKSGSDAEEVNLAVRAKESKNKKAKKSASEAESDHESSSLSESETDAKNKKRKSRNTDPHADPRIKRLKRYLRTARISVRYGDLWKGCKSNAKRIERIKNLLKEKGIKGRPTLEKCEKLRKSNERAQEVAELDTNNIISEGRVTRSSKAESNKTTPVKREGRTILKRIKPVCDSDTE